eukprot:symbB.v1.2.022531.t1/scaffold1991.1/size93473/1
MGFDPGVFGLDRMQAVALPAPALRVISQAKIDSLCNLAGFTENVMEFHVHIASPLQVNAGLFLAGSELTRGTLLRCWPETLTEAKLDGNNGFCEARQIRNGHRWAPWRFFPSKPYVSTGLQFQTVSFGGAHSGHREEAGNLLAREGKTAGMMYPSKLEATEAYNHLNY